MYEFMYVYVSTPFCLTFVHKVYRLFHKTLPRSIAFVNWISLRFYETGCVSAGDARGKNVIVGISKKIRDYVFFLFFLCYTYFSIVYNKEYLHILL